MKRKNKKKKKKKKKKKNQPTIGASGARRRRRAYISHTSARFRLARDATAEIKNVAGWSLSTFCFFFHARIQIK
ncbi:hypothetical protein I7I53_11202 [Histoplasma capsulatum var. duboisii H88]|uniref:Uncharacterized protein n=1 Tax=Ajellomyces capsulatus (strain H88) TaxID=544711 RepID=A0A8A1LES1_AJEC8|nr:hypothetical protein I7I53_11202 [Histoplasma capsulatum var. duboisii H88]